MWNPPERASAGRKSREVRGLFAKSFTDGALPSRFGGLLRRVRRGVVGRVVAGGIGGSAGGDARVVAPLLPLARARLRPRSGRRRRTRLQPDDAEAQDAVGDLQRVVEALEQRGVARLELEEVVGALGAMVHLVREPANAPV